MLDERIDGQGRPCRLTLRLADAAGRLLLEEDHALIGELPALAVRVVMTRYGRPLDGPLSPAGATLQVGGGALVRLRYRSSVDVIGRDYLVWLEDGAEPLAALGAQVAAALRHLAAARGG